MIYHIVGTAQWEAAQQLGQYSPASIESEGFIHLSKSNQIIKVANFLYRERPDLILLVVDEAAISADLRWEDSHNNGELFPHLYRPLLPSEVLTTHSFPPNPDGTFTLPSTLLNAEQIEHIVPITLSHIHREYPNYVALPMSEAVGTLAPHMLFPAFYGSFDWHSSVHSHWQLLRAIRSVPYGSFVAQAQAALSASFDPAKLAGELAYLQANPYFERPYGLAWLLQLSAELREWHPTALETGWLNALAPLEQHVANSFKTWLPKLNYPTRTGTHRQTAFSLSLVWDWATVAGDNDMLALIRTQAKRYFYDDVAAPLAFEPSAADFLSPSLAEADLMRRVLDAETFEAWLSAFLPMLPTNGNAQWLAPVAVTDPNDGQDAHFGGLNLSRAWMLEGVSAALAETDSRQVGLRASAAIHRQAGLPYTTRTEYMLSHWIPSFGIYLLTKRGIA
ncbi:MAG: DUF2891 family protein [Candidatus Promineifilaceae bacterium]